APLAVTCTPPSGATFALGVTTVTCSATDAQGNTSTGQFNVTVQDTAAPTLVLPTRITAQATGAEGAAVTYDASAIDLVDGSVPLECSVASGDIFLPGTTTVTCSAIDAQG